MKFCDDCMVEHAPPVSQRCVDGPGCPLLPPKWVDTIEEGDRLQGENRRLKLAIKAAHAALGAIYSPVGDKDAWKIVQAWDILDNEVAIMEWEDDERTNLDS